MTASTTALTRALADRYRIEREIGQGGMATVYLARDLRHDRDVAIKVLFPDLAAALGGERFLTEIKTTARLQHPHILPLLDSGDADGLLYYVMPFVQGETLRARLEREQLLPIDEAVAIACEVADALEHAHHLGIVHRDVKPENILLHEGHAVVADFGIALAVQQAGGQRMTQTGLSLGTPQYMSPEQAMGEKHIDARADIYALGAVAYEMLVGDPPFTGSTVQAIVAKVLTEKPVRVITQRDRVPPNVEAAVLRALEKVPADRWSSARAFAQALQDASRMTSASMGVPSGAGASVMRVSARTAGIAAALIIGASAAGFYIGSSRTRSEAGAQPMITSILPPPGGSFGDQRALALTRDGRKLAFLFLANDGTTQLMVQDLATRNVRPVAGSVGSDAPFWSPDGKGLAFFANGSLMVVHDNGARQLCGAVTNPQGGSWGDDGTIIFAHHDGIVSVPSSGGKCSTVIASAGQVLMQPTFVPGSRRFMWIRSRQVIYSDADGKVIAELPLRETRSIAVPQSGQLLLAAGLADSGGIQFQEFNPRTGALRGGRTRLVSSVRENDGIGTFAASTSGNLVVLGGTFDKPYLEYDAGGALRDTIRIDGQWTAHARRARAGPPMIALGGLSEGIWTYDFQSHRSTRVDAKDPVSAKRGDVPYVVWPTFSPDGALLAYETLNSQGCGIAERNLAKGTERILSPIMPLGQCKWPQDWAPDGKSLLVRADSVLEVIDLDGKVITRISRPGVLIEGTFSPDGRSVAFSSKESGRAEIYAQALPSGPATRVSNEGGRQPYWTTDGKRVVYITADGRVQEVAMNGTAPSGNPHTRFSVPTWRRPLFDDGGTGFVMIGDAERFIIRQAVAEDALTFVQHWPAMLAR
jgi:serine/threonine protein kinase